MKYKPKILISYGYNQTTFCFLFYNTNKLVGIVILDV